LVKVDQFRVQIAEKGVARPDAKEDCATANEWLDEAARYFTPGG